LVGDQYPNNQETETICNRDEYLRSMKLDMITFNCLTRYLSK